MTAPPCGLCGATVVPPMKKYCTRACFLEHRQQRKRTYDKARYAEQSDRVKRRAQDWYEANRDRKRDYDREYRARTADRRNRATREYYARRKATDPGAGMRTQQRRRARRADNGVFIVSAHDLGRTLARFGDSCAYCRTPFGQSAPLEWDHVVPISRGGRHSIGNLAPTCRRCNRSKGRRLLAEWRLALR